MAFLSPLAGLRFVMNKLVSRVSMVVTSDTVRTTVLAAKLEPPSSHRGNL